MKITGFSGANFTLAVACLLASGIAAAAGLSFRTIVATFDAPGAADATASTAISNRGTTPYAISNIGDVAGAYTDASGVRRGFVRFRNGTYSAPIVDPNDAGSFTEARGINVFGTVDGLYNQGLSFDGFTLRKGVFTDSNYYSAYGKGSNLLGINDRGHEVGVVGSSPPDNRGSILINGQLTLFNAVEGVDNNISSAGLENTFALAINNLDEVVGFYDDPAAPGTTASFLRRPNGTVVTIKYPGALATRMEGINDLGWVTGQYTDSTGHTHGLLYIRGRYWTYDPPGAISSSINGVTDYGLAVVRYTDADNVRHGSLVLITIDR